MLVGSMGCKMIPWCARPPLRPCAAAPFLLLAPSSSRPHFSAVHHAAAPHVPCARWPAAGPMHTRHGADSEACSEACDSEACGMCRAFLPPGHVWWVADIVMYAVMGGVGLHVCGGGLHVCGVWAARMWYVGWMHVVCGLQRHRHLLGVAVYRGSWQHH